jgi:hypothetical protein
VGSALAGSVADCWLAGYSNLLGATPSQKRDGGAGQRAQRFMPAIVRQAVILAGGGAPGWGRLPRAFRSLSYRSSAIGAFSTFSLTRSRGKFLATFFYSPDTSVTKLRSATMADPSAARGCRLSSSWRHGGRPRPAAFLDRDGVLNRDRGYVHRPVQVEWIDGAVETVRRFNDLGYYTFVVTNQSGFARNYYSEEQVHGLHAWMSDRLAEHGAFIDAFSPSTRMAWFSDIEEVTRTGTRNRE